MTRKALLAISGLNVVIIAGLAGFYLSSSTPKQTALTPVQAATAPMSAGSEGIIGSRRPDFSLPDVAGHTRNIGEWDGKVVAINFWATWCPPCIKEIPEFVELQHKYQDQGLQFIGIALQRPEEVTDFMQANGMNYPVLAGEMEVIEISASYGNNIGALPYTVIIDREGVIRYVKRGPLAGEVAEAVISELL